MKKYIFLSLMLMFLGGNSLLNASQKSGLFLGVNAGLPITSPSYGGLLNSVKDALPINGIGYALSVDIGFKHALSQSMGLKYYLEYNYNEAYGKRENTVILPVVGLPINKVEADISQHLITANIDYYYNPTDLFGLYIGLGFGYQSFKPTWTPTTLLGSSSIGGARKGGFALPLNLGFTFNVTDANQIILGLKVPLVSYNYKTEVALLPGQLGLPANVKLSTYIVQVGYNYTF